jgi:hypothetical protein
LCDAGRFELREEIARRHADPLELREEIAGGAILSA